MSAPNSSMTAQPATSEASSALPIISAPSVAPDTAPSAAQARAAQRKELQLKRQALSAKPMLPLASWSKPI